MKQPAVFVWRNLALPAAWLAIGLGWLPGAFSGEDSTGVFPILAAICAAVAAGAWLGRERLAKAENAGWQRGSLAAVVLAAGLGMFTGAARPAMLAGVVAGLAWWDLADFTQRLERFGRPDDPERESLISAHLRRLALALGLGLLLGMAALAASIDLSLEWAMVLGVLAVLLIRVSIGRALR